MGPERKFINRVHYKLNTEVYKECTTGMGGGVPDYYYEGLNATLRIEYKAVPIESNLPKIIKVNDPKSKHGLTALQRRWLNRHYDNGHDCWVVVGSKTGGVILTEGEWNDEHELEQRFEIYTPAEVAAFIDNFIKLGGRQINSGYSE